MIYFIIIIIFHFFISSTFNYSNKVNSTIILKIFLTGSLLSEENFLFILESKTLPQKQAKKTPGESSSESIKKVEDIFLLFILFYETNFRFLHFGIFLQINILFINHAKSCISGIGEKVSKK